MPILDFHNEAEVKCYATQTPPAARRDTQLKIHHGLGLVSPLVHGRMHPSTQQHQTDGPLHKRLHEGSSILDQEIEDRSSSF